MVAVPLSGAIEVGAAATVDCDVETAPGVTVTVAVCVMAVPFAVAEMVFVSATVELNPPVATPLASVRPGCEIVFPVPVAERATVAPGTGLPFASFTVTVITDVVDNDGECAWIVAGDALTVDSAADTPPPPPPDPALISTPSAPALLLDHVASIVLSFAVHSANTSQVVPSPEGCSSIRAKPLPAAAAGGGAGVSKTPQAPPAGSAEEA